MEQKVFLTYRPEESVFDGMHIYTMIEEWMRSKCKSLDYYAGWENGEHVYDVNKYPNHCHVAIVITGCEYKDLDGLKRAFYREWEKREYPVVDKRHAFAWEEITNLSDTVGYCYKTYADLSTKNWVLDKQEEFKDLPPEVLIAALKFLEKKNEKKKGQILKPVVWADYAFDGLMKYIIESGKELRTNPWKWNGGRKDVMCTDKTIEDYIETYMYSRGYMCMQPTTAWCTLKQRVEIYVVQTYAQTALHQNVQSTETATKHLQQDVMELL